MLLLLARLVLPRNDPCGALGSAGWQAHNSKPRVSVFVCVVLIAIGMMFVGLRTSPHAQGVRLCLRRV